MRRLARAACAAGIFATAAMLSAPARAQDAAPASPSPAAAQAAPPTAAPVGVVVVALAGSMDAAWPLARAVYAQPSLRPPGVDEATARVLCGEAPAAGAPRAVHDLADTVSAIKGDDMPSRTLLAEIARRTSARAVVVVRPDAGQAGARVFLPDTGVFDAATYAPDAATTPLTWNAAAQSLARAYGGASAAAPVGVPAGPSPTQAPALATHAEPALATTPPPRRAFYESGWFWGALGAAAFAGGAAYFATRDNGASTIHLQMQVPH
jgi:hypothetical protein